GAAPRRGLGRRRDAGRRELRPVALHAIRGGARARPPHGRIDPRARSRDRSRRGVRSGSDQWPPRTRARAAHGGRARRPAQFGRYRGRPRPCRGLCGVRLPREGAGMIERERGGKVLLSIARDGIADRLGTARCGRWPEPWLEERAATFVTLRLAGDVCGCIGSLEAVRALGEDVYDNARAAAYRDPRFPPVGDRERDGLEVEISILSQAEPIAAATESDALAALRPGLDGV